jgi:hypothetical protein
MAASPFHATRPANYYADSFAIPVSFTPTHYGLFTGILRAHTTDYFTEQTFQIVLRGYGTRTGPYDPIAMSVSPNPFNLTTTLRYTLQESGEVKITLFDVLGRAAKEIDLGTQESGDHATLLSAADLSSGIYFIRLQTNSRVTTTKILLLK